MRDAATLTSTPTANTDASGTSGSNRISWVDVLRAYERSREAPVREVSDKVRAAAEAFYKQSESTASISASIRASIDESSSTSTSAS